MPARLAAANPGLYQFLLNKWYFDELYDLIFVRPAFWIGTRAVEGLRRLAGRPDHRRGPRPPREGRHRAASCKLQSGYLYHYAFAMLIGIAALLTWAIAAGGLLG